MSLENKTHHEAIDIVAELARTETLKHGGHVPTLIVTGTKRGMVGELAGMPDTHEERAQMLFEAGFNIVQEMYLGIPVQLFFISEAWYSEQTAADNELEMMPSADPNRMEVIIIAGLHLIHALHSVVILEMVRDEADQLLEVREHSRHMEQGQVESPLLHAFLKGYQAGLKADNNASQLPS